jgi:hypothetical protein
MCEASVHLILALDQSGDTLWAMSRRAARTVLIVELSFEPQNLAVLARQLIHGFRLILLQLQQIARKGHVISND